MEMDNFQNQFFLDLFLFLSVYSILRYQLKTMTDYYLFEFCEAVK